MNKMTKTKSILSILILSLLGFTFQCNSTKIIIARPEPEDTHLCESACQKMSKLKCDEANDIIMKINDISECTTGKIDKINSVCIISCTEFCIELQTKSHIWLNPSCILKDEINSCEKIENCAPNQ